ncbi:MAG: rhodanese-like domain-containing protein [Deltaproteobacteria bacterium]|nr:rhodanese-like domain-containing protein [Deltaproteobacteria bacterium]
MIKNWFSPAALLLCLVLAFPALAASKSVTIEEAKRLFDSGQAVFVDARFADEYEASHIRGAVNLPADEFERFFPQAEPLLDKNAVIIAYCDGEFCTMSDEVAEELFKRGFADVRILHDGWNKWLKRKLPVSKGLNP